MRAFLTLIVLMLAGPVLADEMVYRENKDTMLRLEQGACSPKVLTHLREEFHGRFKAAVAVIGTTTYLGCWTLHTPTLVYIHYEDNDRTMVSLRLFKLEPGI